MASMKKLTQMLLQQVGWQVEHLGFKIIPASQSFQREFPDGAQSLHLAFIRHKSDFDVTADIAIRLNVLQEALSEGSPKPSEVRDAFSFGAELGNICEGRQKRWTVTSEADIPPVSRQILQTFMDVGLPYLERFSDKQTALNALSGDNKEAWLHMPLHNHRANLAIGLAYLLGNKEEFQRIAAHKLEFLIARKDTNPQKFIDFKEKLENRFQNY